MFRKILTRLFAISFAILLAGGCQQVAKDLKKAKSDIEKTKSNTIKNLNRIQQHGSVDIEVRMQFEEVYQAYTNFIQTKQRPPRSWYELETVAKTPSLIQEVQRRGVEIVFNVPVIELASSENDQSLLLVENAAKSSEGWAMTVTGAIQKVTAEQLKTIPMAEQAADN